MKAKKNDFILIGIVLIIALGIFLGYRVITGSGNGGTVLISTGGTEYARLSLKDNGTYIIKASEPLKKISSEEELKNISAPFNILTINDGVAYMKEASCPDLLCVHQAKISKTGEQIVCLPNKIVVEIINGEKSDVDVVST